MTRALFVFLVFALAIGQPAIAAETVEDPLLAVLSSGQGPVDVAAPAGDPLLDAVSWNGRPRRAIVDDLAAMLLRGDLHPGTTAATYHEVPRPPSRIPAADPDGTAPRPPRLASFVPADAAVLFLDSVRHGERVLDEACRAMPEVLPGLFEERDGIRDGVGRAVERILLPTIWRANPQVPTGTGAAAIVVDDPDLRWAADVALVVEIRDLGRLVAQRRASFRWESARARFRTDGLDAFTDDGSVRSFFAVDGGIAVFSTSRSLRDRVLAAARGEAPALAGTADMAWALRAFPATDGETALLVIPDGFVARVNAADRRLRRAGTLVCEAMRLLVDARSLDPGRAIRLGDRLLERCPCGGRITPVAGSPGAWCDVHGNAESPVPGGDVPPLHTLSGVLMGASMPGGPFSRGAVPVAARLEGEGPFGPFLDVAFPPGECGRRIFDALLTRAGAFVVPTAPDRERATSRLHLLQGIDGLALPPEQALVRLTGLGVAAPGTDADGGSGGRPMSGLGLASFHGLAWRDEGGILTIWRKPFAERSTRAGVTVTVPLAAWR